MSMSFIVKVMFGSCITYKQWQVYISCCLQMKESKLGMTRHLWGLLSMHLSSLGQAYSSSYSVRGTIVLASQVMMLKRRLGFTGLSNQISFSLTLVDGIGRYRWFSGRARCWHLCMPCIGKSCAMLFKYDTPNRITIGSLATSMISCLNLQEEYNTYLRHYKWR